MGKGVERVFKKFLPKLNASSLINTSWHTDADGFLEHSLSQGCLYYKGPTLLKIIPGFFGSPPNIYTHLSVYIRTFVYVYVCVCVCVSSPKDMFVDFDAF